MDIKTAIMTYQYSLRYLLAIVDDFEEKDADFKPAEGAMTVVQQIRHTAVTVDWFWEGAFGKGFNEDFEAFEREVQKPSTLHEAIGFLKEVHQQCIDALGTIKDEELSQPMAPNNIMGELPKKAVISGTADHSAHHRGSLAVYLRLTGKTPKIIYG